MCFLMYQIPVKFQDRKSVAKPWNPLIANAFYRAGVIERWGSGTTNIISWCEDNGNPIPKWEERAGSVVVTFFPISEVDTPQVTMEVTMEVARLLPLGLGSGVNIRAPRLK
jgi:predicted HTH transcriptional regulator